MLIGLQVVLPYMAKKLERHGRVAEVEPQETGRRAFHFGSRGGLIKGREGPKVWVKKVWNAFLSIVSKVLHVLPSAKKLHLALFYLFGERSWGREESCESSSQRGFRFLFGLVQTLSRHSICKRFRPQPEGTGTHS